jgi:hypothetical protein
MQHMVQMGLKEKCKTKVIQRDQIPKYIVVEEHMAIQMECRRQSKMVKIQIAIQQTMLCKYKTSL